MNKYMLFLQGRINAQRQDFKRNRKERLMNTKEAIEYLTLTKIESRSYEGKNYDEIISLLQRDEKYKAIVEELEKLDVYGITWRLEEIKQKYFPKPEREKINDIINKVIYAKLLTKERDDIIALLVSLRDNLVKGGK